MQNDNTAVACLACGSQDTGLWTRARDIEYDTTADVFGYFQCTACTALSIDPVPDDRLAEIYPSTYYSYGAGNGSLGQRVKRRLDRRHFRRVLASVPGPELSMLDIGGGAGWELVTARAADRRVTRTTVIDLADDVAALAEANGHTYVCSRIEDYRTEERYDAILMLNLIEHVRDPGSVLAGAAQLLGPGGVLLLKTPNHDALDARLFRQRGWAGLHCPRHWVLFTRQGFEALATKQGLRVRSMSYTQGAPFWAASVLALLADRGWVRITKERPAVAHPLYGLLAICFAAFDFLRLPLSRPSQMVFILERAVAPASLPGPRSAMTNASEGSPAL